MTAVYLGVVLVPLIALVWNLAPRRETGRRFRLPHIPTDRLARLAARLPRPRRKPKPAEGLGLAPDVPRSPSAPGWEPAPGYSAAPQRETQPV